VAVAAAVALAIVATNTASKTEGEQGSAGAVTEVEVTPETPVPAIVAAAERRFGPVEVIRHDTEAVPGSVERLDVRAQNPRGRYGRPMLSLRSGRYPHGAGEVALTDGALDALAARPGGHVAIGRRERLVVGTVENPSDLDDEFALLAPSPDAPTESVTLLLPSDRRSDAPSAERASDGAAPPIQFRIRVGSDDRAAVAAGVLFATTLAMVLVCLVAASGFLVVAQRRQRQLGLLAALGATERHLRLVMLANGTLVGVVAAVVGGALGFAGWLAAAPAVEAAAAHRIDRLDLPWGLVASCLALAVVAATAAAWWPARTMSRVPVMAALSRRPNPPLPVRRSSTVALALATAGVLAVASARPTGDHVRPVLLIAGVVALTIGITLAAPLAIRALAAPARHLPFSSRLALRDLVRHQARASAALAAIALGLGLAVSVTAVAKATEPAPDEGNLSSRQLLLRPAVGLDPLALDIDQSDAEQARLEAAAADVAAAAGGARRLPLEVAVNPRARSDVREPISLTRPIDNGFRFVGIAYVATPGLLHRMGVDTSTTDDATDLVTTRADHPVLLDIASRAGDGTGTPQEHVDGPTFSSAPTSLITEAGMRRHGWVAAPAGWLLESATPLTHQQLTAAREVAAASGFEIEARASQDDLATLRTVASGMGASLAVAVIAMTIGLIRGESSGDLRTLTAVGAAGRTRRALTANAAGALGSLGVVLGTAGAYLALLATYHADLGRLASPPLPQLLLVALGVPVLAAAAGWLLGGREPSTFSRQALD
jgi:putative ABC transport system permease protein